MSKGAAAAALFINTYSDAKTSEAEASEAEASEAESDEDLCISSGGDSNGMLKGRCYIKSF